MQYITLGNSNLNVSRICMGCMGFGVAAAGMHAWTLPEEESRAVIRAGLEAGINFFDTAMGYQGGTSEEFLGRAVRDFARREDVVLATKFTPRTPEEIAAGISGQEHVERMLEGSLRRLGTDYVDLYICHMWDYHTPIEEILEGLHRAIQAGKVRYAGISNCYAWQLCKANAIARQNGWEPFISVQGHYNLIFREEEREMVPFCKEEKIAMTPYSALASGRLAKHPGEVSVRMERDAYAKGKYDATKDQDALIIRRVAQLAERRGVSMTAISLAWLLTKVAAPVVGCTKQRHIDGAVEAVETALTPEEIAWLEEPYVPHALVGVMASNY
ncbi:MAG TPA: aldo/keto reductase [Candidatus Intestinimonas stercorigallinarum]|nr:aldo/keto reductase [Candidatus Intestinimonas stercorigallinarum]